MTELLDPAVSLSPYPGLRSFYRSEFDIFFGRDDHVSGMVKKLSENRFLCITGPSGCGKSSLARTGLFNALEAGFLHGCGSDWIFCDLFPQTDPLQRLCTSLATAIIMGESGRVAPEPSPANGSEIAELTNLFLNHIKGNSSDLSPAVEMVTAVEGRPIAILVDQFEEIFRYAQDDPDAVSRFVDVLLKTAAAESGVYVIITIRTDQLEKCARYPGLTGAINQSQFLTPTLDRFQMQEAIEGPISLFNGRVAPELTIWMLNGLEEQLDKLPLMQHALRLLYDDARMQEPHGPVTIGIDDFYRVFQIERVKGDSLSESHKALGTSLSHRLDTLYNRLDQRQKKLARGLFCALTTMESQGRDIRRPLDLGEATATLDCGLDELMSVILVFRDRADTYLRIVGEEDGIDRHDIVDVTHECILRLWEPLQTKWLPKEQRAGEKIEHLARTARDRERDVKGGFLDRLFGRGLLTGDTHKRYSEWWFDWKPNATWAARYLEEVDWFQGDKPLGTDEIFKRVMAFCDMSEKHADEKKYGIIAAVFTVMLAAYYMVVQQIRTAEARAEIAEAQQVAANNHVMFLKADKARLVQEQQDDAERAILAINPTPFEQEPIRVAEVAADAVDRAIDVGLPSESVTAAQQKLMQAMSFVREYRRFSQIPQGNGDTPASDFLPGDRAQVFAGEFMPGENRIATLTDGLQLAVWNADNIEKPERVLSLAGYQTRQEGLSGRSMAVAPDGTVAVGTQFGAVLLVEGLEDPDSTPRIRELYSGPGKWDYSSVFGLAFSRDGRTLIAGALTGDVVIWQRGPGSSWRKEAAFRSVDVLGRERGGTNAGPVVLGQQHRAVWSVDLSPDNRFAAMSLGNGTICLVTLDGQSANCRADGHEEGEAVKVVRFAPGGERLYSAGNDDRTRIWMLGNTPDTRADEMLPSLSLSPAVLWNESDVWDLDFSPDGRLLVTATWDGALSLFETGTGKPLYKLRGHTQSLRSVAFGPSGQRILSASLDKTARLWTPFANRADEFALTTQLPNDAPSQRIRSVALGSDAQWAALTAGPALWLMEKGEEPRRLDMDRSSGSGNITRVAAPATGNLIAAATQEPAVVLVQKDPDGAWKLRNIGLDSEEYDDPLINRFITVSDDGERYATNAKGSDGYAVLVCAVDDLRCGTAPDAHVAIVPFPREIDHGRPADDACNRPALPTALALSPSGRYLAIGGTDCNVRLIDLDLPATENRMVGAMTQHVGTINALDFAHDGMAMVTGSADWTARYWKLSEDSSTALTGHRSAITDVRFMPQDHRVATVSGDERLIVWDTDDGRPFLELPGFSDTIEALDIKVAGEDVMIASGTSNGDLVAQRFFVEPLDYKAFVEETLGHVRLAEDPASN